jgi:hypothetical protein
MAVIYSNIFGRVRTRSAEIAPVNCHRLGMGHRTQTSMFNIGVDIGRDHRWVGNIEQKTSMVLKIGAKIVI